MHGFLPFLVLTVPVMGEPKPNTTTITDSSSQSSSFSSISSSSTSTPPPPPPPIPAPSPASTSSLLQPSTKKKGNKTKVLRVFRSVFRSFPIITPTACKFPTLLPGGMLPETTRTGNGTRVTGTLYGYRNKRINLSIQENPRTLPSLVVELAMQTNTLQREMSIGMVRIALECEKRPEKDKTKVLDEPVWTMYCNGKKIGFGLKREANEQDLYVMEVLKVSTMGAGVLPVRSDQSPAEGMDGEMAYMRAHFERVVGSKDSETLYMLSPDGNHGPELSIFFVRI